MKEKVRYQRHIRADNNNKYYIELSLILLRFIFLSEPFQIKRNGLQNRVLHKKFTRGHIEQRRPIKMTYPIIYCYRNKIYTTTYKKNLS